MDLSAAITDQLECGCLLTTRDARLLHANRMAALVIGRNELGDLNSLEDAFGGTPGGAEVLFRLARASQRGRLHSEELEVVTNASDDTVGQSRKWYRITVKPFGNVDLPEYAGRASFWAIEDITADRLVHLSKQGALEAELAHFAALPAGVLVLGREGDVSFANDWLLDWLGYGDPKIVEPRHIDEFVGRHESDLLRRLVSGEIDSDERLDIDFITATGERLTGSCIVAVSPLGAHQEDSITLLICGGGARQTDTATMVDGDAVFGEFFRTAPFGIALIESDGRLQNANPAFRRLMQLAAKPRAGESLLSAIGLELDHVGAAALDQALDAASRGRG